MELTHGLRTLASMQCVTRIFSVIFYVALLQPTWATNFQAADVRAAQVDAALEQANTPATLISFADFYAVTPGPHGVALSPKLLAANGKLVTIKGYMVQQERAALGHFMLTPRPVQMSEQADGDADDLPLAWAMVYLDPEQEDCAIPHSRGLLEVSGVLQVGRHEGPDGRVSWVRLQLPADATRGMNAFEVANYLHSLQHIH